MAWEEKNGSLSREFVFADFKEAFSFLNEVAVLAEAQNHHPEIWNVYNKVRLVLTTHDAGNTITAKDQKLATAINELL